MVYRSRYKFQIYLLPCSIVSRCHIIFLLFPSRAAVSARRKQLIRGFFNLLLLCFFCDLHYRVAKETTINCGTILRDSSSELTESVFSL